MSIFEKIYNRLAAAAKEKKLDSEMDILASEGHKKGQLDCLLHPEKYSPIIKWEKCNCGNKKESKCLNSCKFGALKVSSDGDIEIDKDRCIGCGDCEKACSEKKFKVNKELIPVINALKEGTNPIYAIIAPAFVGQFSKNVSPGRLRTAFKKMGFTGMIEVALFADILTLREALEFDRNINTEKDFQLTSCCCPMWIAMIRKIYKELIPHVPPSVSPMIACGRVIKRLHPNSTVVFIGPCLAKKAEAREPDVKGAVDYVLTFREAKELFALMGVDASTCDETDKEHSSYAGRIYARAGGVSEAVSKTLNKIRKHSQIEIKPVKADGVVECKKMLDKLRKEEIDGNFFEGMGCKGGCVGGPRAIIDKDQGRENVDFYGKSAPYETPAQNLYVLELLHKLGFNTIESLLEDRELFTRNF